jgi:hypothetical protein
MSEPVIITLAVILLMAMTFVLALLVRELWIAHERYVHYRIVRERLRKSEEQTRLWQR